jgi:hypothetical protein
MQAADLYKLLHQGAMGAEHAVSSVDMARRWMRDEIGALGEGPPEPLVDTIAPYGSIVRIHLRPFLDAEGDVAKLLSVFVRTARESAGSEEALTCALDAALGMAGDDALPWPRTVLMRYIEARRAEGYPAVHHSPEFEALFRPAYRVVSGSLVPELVGTGR